MKRYKRLYLLLGVLAVACVVTFAVLQYKQQEEKIQNSGQVVLELASDSVQSLSWDYGGQTLSFHKDEGWIYDDDEAFPVDDTKIEQLLEQFQAFSAAFIIEEVEDYGQYGLDAPTCTIRITAEDQEYEIQLGDYSTMDSQRYVSIGDGNVYLAQHDPLEEFDATLSDLIDHDDIPSFEQVQELTLSGDEELTVTYEEGSTDTYREEDVYFTQRGGQHLPLDPDRVEDYLSTVETLYLTDYVTYNASEEDLSTYGLNDPDLTISVDYTGTDEEGEAFSDLFTLSIARDPAEQEAAQQEDAESSDTDGVEEITAYAQVGESGIVYRLSSADYVALMAASYEDLCHREVLPADFSDISRLEISLENQSYTITAQADGDERTYLYQEEELEIDSLQSALEALKAPDAGSFTTEEPTQKKEIGLTVYLDLENQPTVTLDLYRYDGTSCLAVVDGEPFALVSRESVVDLIEAVNEFALN